MRTFFIKQIPLELCFPPTVHGHSMKPRIPTITLVTYAVMQDEASTGIVDLIVSVVPHSPCLEQLPENASTGIARHKMQNCSAQVSEAFEAVE